MGTRKKDMNSLLLEAYHRVFISGLCVAARKANAAEAQLEYKGLVSSEVTGETAG